MSFPPRIYLTGFMGSGKTTVGRLLARQLGVPFNDLDKEVEKAAAASIPEIFAREGEAAFRRLERIALEHASRLDLAVVSTGGGTLATDQNMELARASGTVVYLRATIPTIIGRIATRANDRPLMASVSQAELPGHLEGLLSQRRRYYERADLVVDVDGRSRKHIVNEIMQRLQRRQG